MTLHTLTSQILMLLIGYLVRKDTERKVIITNC